MDHGLLTRGGRGRQAAVGHQPPPGWVLWSDGAARETSPIVTDIAMGCSVLAALLLAAAATPTKRRPNILFLAADDLRPQLGTYSPEAWAGQHVPMVTPHLDAFANKSMVFLKSYCQQAICMATRASLLTGRRPDTTGVTAALSTYWRTNTDGGNFTSLPQHFREHGYTTVGHGKIFHPGSCSGGHVADGAANPGPVLDPKDLALGDDRPYSWTNDDPDLFPGSGVYHAPNHLYWVCSAPPGYNTSCPVGGPGHRITPSYMTVNESLEATIPLMDAQVSGPFPSWNRSILTEIYIYHACYC
jgi:hypothetical protein